MIPLFSFSSCRIAGVSFTVLLFLASAQTSCVSTHSGNHHVAAGELLAMKTITSETIKTLATTLASPAMEGRGTAQPGGQRAAAYLADRFRQAGLKPLGDRGTYEQAVPFVVTSMLPGTGITVGDVVLEWEKDFLMFPPHPGREQSVVSSLVFVGYGIQSDDLERDDLEGVDLAGKVALVLRGRPDSIDESLWARASTRQRVVASLKEQEVAGIIMVHVESFAQLAPYLVRRRVLPGSSPELSTDVVPLVLASETGTGKIFGASGIDFDLMHDQARRGERVTRDLNVSITLSLYPDVERTTGNNVVGILEGADPDLKDEAVVFCAHYDAFGVDGNKTIYPGAADNALGVAMMASIADALHLSQVRPRRSIIFLAVTGEEYGLLGAKHWASTPTWELERIAAVINFDGIGTETYGPVEKIVAWGGEESSLGASLEEVVHRAGKQIVPDPFPDERIFYRSDHYAFVKAGVPAVMLMGVPDSSGWTARAKAWMRSNYHQPSDTVSHDWNWEGPRTLASIGLGLGLHVANQDSLPVWNTASEFYRERRLSDQPAQ